jgi:hypothetical protein
MDTSYLPVWALLLALCLVPFGPPLSDTRRRAAYEACLAAVAAALGWRMIERGATRRERQRFARIEGSCDDAYFVVGADVSWLGARTSITVEASPPILAAIAAAQPNWEARSHDDVLVLRWPTLIDDRRMLEADLRRMIEAVGVSGDEAAQARQREVLPLR